MKDIYKISIDITSIKNAKGSIDAIANSIKGLNVEQAIYRMELAKCTEAQITDALLKNKITKSEIESALAKRSNTLTTTNNTIAIKAETIAEEDELLQQWLSIGAEKAETYAKVESTTATTADTVSTTANTVAKGANLGITELLTVAWEKLNAVIRKNPFATFLVVVSALGVAMSKIADRVYNAEKYAKKALDNSAEKVDNVRSEIESLNSDLQTTRSRIDELNTKKNLTLVEREELERLKETNAELERELRIKQSILSEEQQEANKDARKYFTTKKDSVEFELSYEGVEIHEKTDYIGTVEERIEKLQQYTDGKIKLTEATVKEYKDYVNTAISDFMEEDDYLIEGKDDGLLDRLDALYEKYDIYMNGKASVIENKLRDILAKADFQDASKQLEELGKSGELSIATLSSRFPELIEYLDNAGISANELYRYIMALSDPDAINYDNVRKQLMQSLGFGDTIDSAGEAQLWNEISSLGEEELILEAYLKVRDQYGEHPEGWNAKDWLSHIQSELETESTGLSAQLSISETIGQLNTRLKPAFDSLQSAYQDIFTDDGFDLSSIDILSTCDSIRSRLDDMSELGLNVDYSAFEDLVRVLSDAGSTEQDAETAFDALAASITQAALSGSEDFETMKAALEDLGVVNDSIVAFQALAENTDALKGAGLDLANATYSQLEAFAQERLGAEDAAQGVAILVYQQMSAAENPLDTMASIQALAKLGGKAAETAGILAELAQITAQINNLQAWMTDHPDADASLVEATLGGLERKAESLKSQVYTGVDFGRIGGGGPAAGSAGSAAGAAYADAFEEELAELETLHDQGKITEKEYLDHLRRLYERYFKDIDEYAENFAENQAKYLQGMKALYESALSGVTSLLDKQIDAYEDSRSAAVDALEAERDAAVGAKEAEKARYEEEIKSIDKEIDAKEKVIDGINAEIDAIREANNERQRQSDLQRAQYELERMQAQKTILQYSSDKGMHYAADTSGIRDAKDAVDDAQTEITIANKEKEIGLIEKEIGLLEERKDLINEQIDLLDAQIDQINEQYDRLIADTEKYWDGLIKGMEDYKSRWEELGELEEQAEMIETLRSLGIETDDILNMSEEAFARFKDEYIGILADIYSGNDLMLAALSDSAGRSVAEMGSYITATQGYIDSLNGIGSSLAPAAEAVGNVDANMGRLASAASDAAANISETAARTGEAADNVKNIAESLDWMPDSQSIMNLSGAFSDLAESIGKVAQALGADNGTEIAALLQTMSGLNTISLGNEGEGIIGQFTLLKNAVTDVINTIGLAGDETVGSLMLAVSELDTVTLGEDVIAQFNSLKAAVDSVSSAISGGGSSGSEDSPGGESISGTFKGGKQARKGFEPGNGSSITDAITSLGDTADRVIGTSDAKDDKTVIGKFSSLETAVDNVTAAIGSGDAESAEGQDAEGSDDLSNAITELGETTKETLGEPEGDGVIGRFEKFKDVIGEANEHVTGIYEGLQDIDDYTAECTIIVNIEQNGELPGAVRSGTDMNLDDAQYHGSTGAEGTASVSGRWPVQTNEKRSLVGELGYEIVVRDGRFFTVGNTGPEMFPIKKGDIIFNHEQSVELLKKGHTSGRGKAYADGMVGGGRSLIGGTVVGPYDPEQDDSAFGKLYTAWNAHYGNIDKNVEEIDKTLTHHLMLEHNRQMNEEVNRFMSNSNIINNNKNVQQPVIHQHFNITMPNITNSTSAEMLLRDLQSLGTKKLQVDW